MTDYTALVAELRKSFDPLDMAAANAIEQLQRENAQMRNALAPFAAIKLVRDWRPDYAMDVLDTGDISITAADVRAAREFSK